MDASPASLATGHTEHFDVLIVGAGISGVGAAYHLKDQCPGKSFVILEALESFGGTWLTHKYPGIRSDSDLYTFGYRFKPWVGAPIASAEEILKYMDEVIEENDLARHIRYRRRISDASWNSKTNLWTVVVERTDTGEAETFTTNFLWMCQGYYRHSKGYTPQWPGMAAYQGRIVHPQTWPDDLDYAGKKVLLIGSGATAATLIPAIAGDAAHVTMLQRSPTYFIPGRNANDLADQLRELEVDEAWIHEIVRRRILKDQAAFTQRSFEEPEAVKQELLAGVSAFVGPEATAAQFTPHYRPWRQRIAFVPEGDLFRAVLAGKASAVTGEIETFTETGVRLADGTEIEADIIITATGFEMSVLGDISFSVDGKAVDFAKTLTYRGMMFTGVPNLVWIMGYFRASWTLRVDIVADFVCRLLNHLAAAGAKKVEVGLRPEDEGMEQMPWIDPENFNPGYLMRAMNKLPRRGAKAEWQHTQDYWAERRALPLVDLDGPEFVYGGQAADTEPALQAAE
jgi:cation diffusion facilitator CzcD-associated flavoprotein CzcO